MHLHIDQMIDGLIIENTKGIKFIMSRNDALMQPTLNIAKSRFAHAEGLGLSHMCAAAGRTTAIKARVSVDHVIALDKVPRRNLVVGLGKSSTKFSIAGFIHDHGPLQLTQPAHLSVLSQLAHFYKAANTPYGYIQTDKELVACWFKRDGDPDKDYKVYVMAIPWSSYGTRRLTTDLGLWWLCMKALSPEHDPQMEQVDASGAEAAPPPDYLSQLFYYNPDDPSTWTTEFSDSV